MLFVKIFDQCEDGWQDDTIGNDYLLPTRETTAPVHARMVATPDA